MVQTNNVKGFEDADGNVITFGTITDGQFLKRMGSNVTSSTVVGGSEAFPIGSVFIAVVNTNPATLLGYGSWSAFGAGRVLIGLDAGDADFDTVEEEGGAKAVASSAQSFAGNSLAAHQHDAITAGTPAGSVSWPVGVPTFSGTPSTDVVNHLHTLATGTGSTGSFSQVIGTVDTSSGGTGATPTQTALATRSGNPVAGGVANYTPAGTVAWPAGVSTFAGNQLATHQHAGITAGTPSGTNTPGNATSVVQPYIVVYMWKRVA